MKISEKLIKLRKEHGLNQTEFANKIGVTQKTVSFWEQDKNIPWGGFLVLKIVTKLYKLSLFFMINFKIKHAIMIIARWVGVLRTDSQRRYLKAELQGVLCQKSITTMKFKTIL